MSKLDKLFFATVAVGLAVVIGGVINETRNSARTKADTQGQALMPLLSEQAQANNDIHLIIPAPGHVYAKRQEQGAAGTAPIIIQPDPQGITPPDQNVPGGTIYIGPDGTPQFVETLPKIDLTLADAVDIMAEYELVHETKLMSHLRYYGLTDPNTRTIFLNVAPDNASNRDTIIHEWLHIKYGRMGIDTSGPYEDQIAKRAHEIYLQLYGQQN